MMAGGFITFKGGPEIARALARIEKSVAGGLARGAVGRGADQIMIKARQIASGNGLMKKGRVTTPAGNTFERRGMIPPAISAAVDRKQGTKTLAKVFVDVAQSEAGRPSRGGAPHWVMVEFGSINNAPMPFMRPGLAAGSQAAVDAIIMVLADGIRRYNKPGG